MGKDKKRLFKNQCRWCWRLWVWGRKSSLILLSRLLFLRFHIIFLGQGISQQNPRVFMSNGGMNSHSYSFLKTCLFSFSFPFLLTTKRIVLENEELVSLLIIAVLYPRRRGTILMCGMLNLATPLSFLYGNSKDLASCSKELSDWSAKGTINC